jgi:hypothetical protein
LRAQRRFRSGKAGQNKAKGGQCKGERPKHGVEINRTGLTKGYVLGRGA